MKTAQNEELLNALRDSRLQELIKKIDSSTDRIGELDATVERDPDFVNFLDKMLKTVEYKNMQ